MSENQRTADVLMIRPASFCANPQTADSNRFQRSDTRTQNPQEAAIAEFELFAKALRDAGVRVHDFSDTPDRNTPDALFPNNWVSFHADGTAVLYPMFAANRRLERRTDILESLGRERGFQLRRVIDLTHHEADERFLEGTGSLVLDRVNRVAYACLSPRTDLAVLGEFAQLLDYEVVVFDATDRDGYPIYHTNVMLSIGAQYAAICSDAIRADQRAGVLAALQSTRHAIVELSHEQMNDFAGNMIELATTEGKSIIALSKRARDALTEAQRRTLENNAGSLVSTPMPTIETLGGGSARCMLAEIFLPRAVDR